MDSLTHIVLGAALGDQIAGKQLGRKAMLWGAFANTIPDFDVFAGSFFSEAQMLLVHRGITHSFLFLMLVSPLLAFIFNKIYSKYKLGFYTWTLLFASGMLSHIVLDSFTTYGTGWLEPFSAKRFSFNNIFVADPHYTLPLLVAFIAALIIKNQSPKRQKWTKNALLISSAYLLFTICNHQYIAFTMYRSFYKQNLKAENFYVAPTPLNNYLWMAYTKDKNGAYVGYYSLFDKSKEIKFQRFERNEYLLKPFENNEALKIFKQFSKGNYIVNKVDSSVYFNDIRYGQENAWKDPKSPFVFKFNLSNKAKQADFRGDFGEAMAALINRIKGI